MRHIFDGTHKNTEFIAAEPNSCPKLTRGKFEYDFGDAAGFAEFTRGEFKGGRILYIWSHILSAPQLGPPVVGQVLRWVIAEARK